MKHQRSPLQSAFFNLRALTALMLCLVGGLFAVVAFKSVTRQSVEEQTVNASENGQLPERDMPVPGEGDEASRISRLEQMWNDRLTYPTGKFNPAWLRKAADQHARMQSAR